MLREIFLVLIACQITSGNYCLCNDIQNEQVCTNPNTYDGICYWSNGRCFEKICDQRMNLGECEPEFGSWWCGWINGSKCVQPSQCSDFSVKKWCIRSGCQWIAGSGNQGEYSTSGECSGTLNSISCMNLNQQECSSIAYFYQHSYGNYENCFINGDGECSGQYSCSFYASEVQCISDQCKWNSDVEECEIKTCSDLKTDQQCSAYTGDDLTAFLCEWNTAKQECQNIDCKNIKEETRCINETLGYDGGRFCSWVNGKCQENNCDNGQDQESCLHESYMNGGVSTCTWVVDQNGNNGQCYTCNGNGPVINKNGQLIYNGILLISLLMMIG